MQAGHKTMYPTYGTVEEFWPYKAKWAGWRKWNVVYLQVREGHGRIVATFNGKFAYNRAHARAKRLMSKWRKEHTPIPGKLIWATGIHHPA